MHIINEKGRSMIEMLGVLAIIGVLTVGSLSIIGKARQQYTITQILNETTTLVSSARKMACDYDDAYGSYTNMLYRSDAYPEGVTFKKEGDSASFVLSSDAEIAIDADGENNSAFKVTLSNIPASACVAVLTSDWNTNGLISAATNQSSEAKVKVVDLDVAATACAGEGAELILTFTGCTRADQE
ncbi:MAG: hypothetical protein IKR92_05590 [Alphaproteobacteria bacterium]|nr:hypothetical protein [Alphaproteobacteria bacterium]